MNTTTIEAKSEDADVSKVSYGVADSEEIPGAYRVVVWLSEYPDEDAQTICLTTGSDAKRNAYEIARLLAVHEHTVALWLSGASDPGLDEAQAIGRQG